MKELLLAFLIFSCSTSLIAQIEGEEYFDEIYSELNVTSDQVYGANYWINNLGISPPLLRDLKMDIYQASDNDSESKPVIIVAHSGYFLPPLDDEQNTISGRCTGTKTDSSVVELCKRLALRGFVAIAYDYRLGWNPLANSKNERAQLYTHILYRSLQDTHTLLRWIQKSANEEGNPYGLDPDKVAMIGEGSGGDIAYAAAALNSIEKIQLDQFSYFNNEGNQLYYIDPEELGNWDGKGYPEPSDTNAFEPFPEVFIDSNIPNHIEYNGELDFAFAYGGALLSTEWLDESCIPMAAMQTIEDPFAPFYSDVTFSISDQVVWDEVHGAGTAIPMFNALGINDILDDRIYDDEYSLAALNATLETEVANEKHLFPFRLSAGSLSGSPWEWWSPAFWSDIPYASQANFSVHDFQLNAQPNMSAERGIAYIDTVLNFFCPRAIAAMGISTETGIAVNVLDLNVRVSPNPVMQEIRIDAQASDPIESIQLFDMSGRLLRTIDNLDSGFVRMDRANLQPGVYFIRVKSGDKVAVKKLLFS